MTQTMAKHSHSVESRPAGVLLVNRSNTRLGEGRPPAALGRDSIRLGYYKRSCLGRIYVHLRPVLV